MGCDRPSKLWLVLPGIYSNLTRTNTPIGKMFLAALLKFWCVKIHGSVFVCKRNKLSLNELKRTVFILILGSSLVSCKLRVKLMSNVTENITHLLLVKRPTNLTYERAERDAEWCTAFANAKCYSGVDLRPWLLCWGSSVSMPIMDVSKYTKWESYRVNRAQLPVSGISNVVIEACTTFGPSQTIVPVQPSRKQLGSYMIGTNMFHNTAACLSCQKQNPRTICYTFLPTIENALINY